MKVRTEYSEPWRRDGDSVFSACRGLVADCYVIATGDKRIDVARRIVAAVNACQGISTEALEQSVVVAKMREAIQLAEIATDCMSEWQQARQAPENRLGVKQSAPAAIPTAAQMRLVHNRQAKAPLPFDVEKELGQWGRR